MNVGRSYFRPTKREKQSFCWTEKRKCPQTKRTLKNQQSNTVQQKPTVQHVLYIYIISFKIYNILYMSPLSLIYGLKEIPFVGLLDCWTVVCVFFLSIRAFFSLSLFFNSGGAGDVKIRVEREGKGYPVRCVYDNTPFGMSARIPLSA